MKLNMYFIKEHLREILVEERITVKTLTQNLEYAALYNGEKQPEGNRVYVARARDLPDEPDLSQKPSFVCIGIPSKIYRTGSCNILVVKEDMTEARLLSLLNKTFHYWQALDEKLRDAIADQKTISDVFGLTADYFKNPVIVSDSKSVIRGYRLPEEHGGLTKEYLSKFSTTIEDVQDYLEEATEMLVDKDFSKSVSMVGPQIFPEDFYGYRALYQNLFLGPGKKFNYQFIVDEVLTKITEADICLLNYVCGLCTVAYKNNPLNTLEHFYGQVLLDLLRHHFLPEHKILQFLKELEWNIEDTYFVLTIFPYESSMVSYYIGQISRLVSGEITNCCYKVLDNNMIYVINLTKQNITQKECISHLLPLFRDNLFHVGISDVFQDFKYLYYYYQQCLIAYQIGLKKNSSYWFYYFHDYALDYIRKQCTRTLIPEALYPRNLRALIRHDQTHNTEYVQLLRTYLECNMSPTRTCEQLHIHKNTFAYRLEKMLQILDMDLSNPENKLWLQIVLSL